MPFSKGILVASVMATGVDPELAYRLAETVEDELSNGGSQVVGLEELTALVEKKLADHMGTTEAATWPAWVAARRSGHPILVLVGGATGTGKSTVATRLANRLHINRVVATADVREVMRASFPETVVPVIHASSFEADQKIRAPLPTDQDPIVAAFRQQAEIVASGARRLIERALLEGTDLIMEGTHLVPGIFASDVERWRRVAAVSQMVLTVTDPETHRAHFRTRLEHAQSRRPPRYLARFDAIRRIQEHILLQAKAYQVPELEVENLDDVVREAADLVVEQLINKHRSDLWIRRGSFRDAPDEKSAGPPRGV
jgi:2-phosphoglycerate kinase